MTFIHHGSCTEPRQNRTFRATRAGRTRVKMARNIQPIWKTANSKDIR